MYVRMQLGGNVYRNTLYIPIQSMHRAVIAPPAHRQGRTERQTGQMQEMVAAAGNSREADVQLSSSLVAHRRRRRVRE